MRLIDADEQIRILESIKKKAVSNGNEVVFRVNNVIKFLMTQQPPMILIRSLEN